MALDRRGIARALRDLFRADTSILYGSSGLLQIIEDKAALFSKARVSNNFPNALFLWVDLSDTTEERMQNIDYLYICNFRFESVRIDPESAANIVDDALERINYLLNEEMYTGTVLSGYYSDTSAQIINMAPVSSTFEYPEMTDGRRMIIEIEGAVEIEVNKWT